MGYIGIQGKWPKHYQEVGFDLKLYRGMVKIDLYRDQDLRDIFLRTRTQLRDWD